MIEYCLDAVGRSVCGPGLPVQRLRLPGLPGPKGPTIQGQGAVKEPELPGPQGVITDPGPKGAVQGPPGDDHPCTNPQTD